MAYTPLTAEEIKSQAETEYQSYYDMMRESSQQSYDTSDLLLSQQISGLDATTDKRLENSEQDYSLAYSESGREQLSRGMGRSSYALQTLANITQEGAEAKQGILDAQAAAESNLEAQRTQLLSQLTEKVSTYDASQAADILKRIDELNADEYNRTYQSERDAAADAQWQSEYNEMIRQFDASLAASKSSGGGGSRTIIETAPPNQGMTFEELMSGLGNSNTAGYIGTGAGTSAKGLIGTGRSTPAKSYDNLSLFAPYVKNSPTAAIDAEEEDVSLGLSSVKTNKYNQPSVAKPAMSTAALRRMETQQPMR